MAAARLWAVLSVGPRHLRRDNWLSRLITWYSLWWQGRADARRGLPGVGADVNGPVITPQLEALTRLAQELFEFERLSLVSDVAALRVRRIELENEAADLRAALSTAEGQRPNVTVPTDAELARRRAGEEPLDISVVQRRRRREHEREAAWHRAQLAEVRTRLTSVQSEASATPLRIAQRELEAAVRVQHVSEAARRWMAVYWRALMRRHPQRHALNAGWLPLPVPMAAWAVDLGADDGGRSQIGQREAGARTLGGAS